MRKKVLSVVVTIVVFVSLLCVINASTKNEIEDKDVLKSEIKGDESKDISYYEDLRDKLLEENLTLHDIGDKYPSLKERALYKENGLVDYVNRKYSNLSPIDKLKKQISVLEYLNRSKALIDFDGRFLDIVFMESQMSDFLISKGMSGNLSDKDNIVFLSENIEELSKVIDFSKEDLVDILTEIIIENLSDEDKQDLINNINVP